MIHHHRSLTLDATPAAVWAVLGRFMQIDEIAPEITRVDALTEGAPGIGAKRRCHFKNGSNLVEEVTEWKPGHSYRVKLMEVDPMPLKEAYAELRVEAAAGGKAKVVWGMDYRLKWGLVGWLMGQTMMKMMMGKSLDSNLQGLAQRLKAEQTA